MPDATTECLFVSHLITQPADAVACSHLVPPRRIQHRQARDAYNALLDIVHDSDPEAVQIPTLLEASKRYTDGGPVDLTWFEPAEIPDPLFWARELHKILCEGDVGRLSAQLAEEPGNRLVREQLSEAMDRLDQSHHPIRSLPHVLTGEGFRGDEIPESSILPGLIVPNHACLIAGDPMGGKSSLQAVVAMAYGMGCSPWNGAPELNGRVLIITPDDSERSIRRKYRRISISHYQDATYRWADRVEVLALGPNVPPSFWTKCKLDETGVILLQNVLEEARDKGNPYDLLILDALLDFVPPGTSENSNEDMAQVMLHAEMLAASQPEGFGLWITHHRGKVGKDQAGDVRAGTRGASAIVQKARLVSLFETDPGDNAIKTVTVEQNEGDPVRPIVFQVCTPDRAEEKRVDYFKPYSPEVVHPRVYFTAEEESDLSLRELAWRIWEREHEEDRPEGKDPGKVRLNAARMLLDQWKSAGWVEVEKRGPRKATKIRLVDPSGPDWTPTGPDAGSSQNQCVETTPLGPLDPLDPVVSIDTTTGSRRTGLSSPRDLGRAENPGVQNGSTPSLSDDELPPEFD